MYVDRQPRRVQQRLYPRIALHHALARALGLRRARSGHPPAARARPRASASGIALWHGSRPLRWSSIYSRPPGRRAQRRSAARSPSSSSNFARPRARLISVSFMGASATSAEASRAGILRRLDPAAVVDRCRHTSTPGPVAASPVPRLARLAPPRAGAPSGC